VQNNSVQPAIQQYSLKDRKSARIKLRILESALELMGRGAFRDISVEQIADRAEISRGTFFNYFSQKEEIMFYYFEIWNFHRAVEHLLHPLIGIKAIERLFEKAAAIYRDTPGVALSVIAFIANLQNKSYRIVITPSERTLLYPELSDVNDIDILQLYERFVLHVDEAVRDGEIQVPLSKKELVNVLESLWYGGFLVARLSGQDIMSVYESNLKWLTSQKASPRTR